jgi:hypothetical protein
MIWKKKPHDLFTRLDYGVVESEHPIGKEMEYDNDRVNRLT